MTPFNDLGLAEPLLRAVAAEGYTHPTPIQIKAIPPILAEADLVGIAQTGTGKTAAFVLPLLDRVLRVPRKPAPRTCRALVLAPTRELAQQIADSIATYGRFMAVSHAVIVGGVKPGPQIRALARGVDILVATPGRLLDHMGTGAMLLAQTETVVLDEADQMMDLGFMPAIRRILARLPRRRQTLLFSATMPKPIRALADEFLNQPVEVAAAPQAKPVDLIAQRVMMVHAADKRGVLVRLLSAPDVGRAIVFTRTKRGADKVNAHLVAAGLNATAIHGNKSQPQRDRALGDFRAERVRILVATDVAARGIDVDGISHVVNFELPNVPEAYVHRIGRTARAGASGIAISLCDSAERPLLRDIERLLGRSIARNGDEAPAPAEPNAAGRGPGRRDEPGSGSARKAKAHRKGARPAQQPSAPRGRKASATDGRDRQSIAIPAEAHGAGLARMLGAVAGARPRMPAAR